MLVISSWHVRKQPCCVVHSHYTIHVIGRNEVTLTFGHKNRYPTPNTLHPCTVFVDYFTYNMYVYLLGSLHNWNPTSSFPLTLEKRHLVLAICCNKASCRSWDEFEQHRILEAFCWYVPISNKLTSAAIGVKPMFWYYFIYLPLKYM